MSQIDDFKQKVLSDSSLQTELSSLARKPRAELVSGVSAIAARHGFALSESEIAIAIDQQLGSAAPRDLSDHELEQIAGGEECSLVIPDPDSMFVYT